MFTTTRGFDINSNVDSNMTLTARSLSEDVPLENFVSDAAQLSPVRAFLTKPVTASPRICPEKQLSVPPPLSPSPSPPCTPSPSPPGRPSSADLVGWKGLLEISRTSGTTGVMASRASVSCEVDGEEPPFGCTNRQLEVCATAHTSVPIRRLVKSVVRGLKACQEPEMSKEGMGGTYFFANENGRKVAILKPCDEEPLAPNNPKGYVGRALGDPGWKSTVRVGEAAMREVAAYLLDHGGFAKVPTSVLVRARHPAFCYNSRVSSARVSYPDLASASADTGNGSSEEPATPTNTSNGDEAHLAPRTPSPHELLPMKLGSLQKFVLHECATSEMGPSRFSVGDVHRIGILDIRLFNTDRHAGNMLVLYSKNTGDLSLSSSIKANEKRELVPIDHGFCLPETLEAPYLEWLHWPQAMQPFSEEELAYINHLDVAADKELLRKELPNLRPECLRVLELGTTLLQRGAQAGLTLFQIASVMSRPYGDFDEEPSELEKICVVARQLMQQAAGASSSGDEIEEEDDLFNGVDMELFVPGWQSQHPAGGSGDYDTFVKGADLAGTKCLSHQGLFLRSSSLLSESSISSEYMSDVSKITSGGLSSVDDAEPPDSPGMNVTPFSSRSIPCSGFVRRQSQKGHPNPPRTKYHPPLNPMMTAGPDSCAISFSDMDEVEWSAFMGTVTKLMPEAVEGGKWKNMLHKFETSASCPAGF